MPIDLRVDSVQPLVVARLASALLLVVAVAAPRPVRAQTPGWTDLDLGAGHRARRYLPTSVRACDPLPLFLFLHGAGGTPEAYEPHLTADAEALGVVLVLPLSTSAGWSDADVPVINAALDAVGAELFVDDTRTYIGGHSAGGAFAYLLGYGGTGVAAVFTMSAPYYGVSSVVEPTYHAPIHMYYGDMDPNYTGGSAAALERQWASLGVPHETDVEAGYGHSTWPASSIRMGYDFLLAQRYPGTPPTSRCGGGTDAGTSIDAAVGVDAAADLDAGSAVDAFVPVDAATSGDGGARRHVASGCGCRAGASGSGGVLALTPALVLLARRGRRRTSGRVVPLEQEAHDGAVGGRRSPERVRRV